MSTADAPPTPRDIKQPLEVPANVRYSEYGCKHCLYFGIECKRGSKYAPAISYDGWPSCLGYAYYD